MDIPSIIILVIVFLTGYIIVYCGHNKIIVLSKELAQNDIKNYIDYFLRSEDSRADVAICVSKEKAKFILESKENDANVPSENILFLINNPILKYLLECYRLQR